MGGAVGIVGRARAFGTDVSDSKHLHARFPPLIFCPPAVTGHQASSWSKGRPGNELATLPPNAVAQDSNQGAPQRCFNYGISIHFTHI